LGKKNTAPLDANQRYLGAFLIAFGNFVRDPG
jgi:hypothetical protein